MSQQILLEPANLSLRFFQVIGAITVLEGDTLDDAQLGEYVLAAAAPEHGFGICIAIDKAALDHYDGDTSSPEGVKCIVIDNGDSSSVKVSLIDSAFLADLLVNAAHVQ